MPQARQVMFVLRVLEEQMNAEHFRFEQYTRIAGGTEYSIDLARKRFCSCLGSCRVTLFVDIRI